MDAVQIAAFLKRYWIGCKYWPRNTIVGWIQWHINNRCAFSVMDNGKPVAVMLAKPLNDPVKHVNNHYEINEQGNSIWISVMVSRNKQSLPMFCMMLIERFGVRKWFCAEREKYSGRIHQQDFHKLTQKLIGSYL